MKMVVGECIAQVSHIVQTIIPLSPSAAVQHLQEHETFQRHSDAHTISYRFWNSGDVQLHDQRALGG